MTHTAEVQVPKYPLYLDTHMMISFLAALEDGVSFEKRVEIFDALRKGAQGEAEAGARASFLGIGGGAKVKGSGELDSEQTEQLNVVKSHTEASLFNRLRSVLHEENLLVTVSGDTDLSALVPGALIEATGRVSPNALDQIISMMESFSQLFELDSAPSNAAPARAKSRNRGGQGTAVGKTAAPDPIEMLKKVGQELNVADMKDVNLELSGHDQVSIVLTLSQDYGTGRTIDSLRDSDVTVLGKVSGVTSQGEINLLRRSALGYMPAPEFDEAFAQVFENPLLSGGKPKVRIPAPVIQVIPMAIFV